MELPYGSSSSPPDERITPKKNRQADSPGIRLVCGQPVQGTQNESGPTWMRTNLDDDRQTLLSHPAGASCLACFSIPDSSACRPTLNPHILAYQPILTPVELGPILRFLIENYYRACRRFRRSLRHRMDKYHTTMTRPEPVNLLSRNSVVADSTGGGLVIRIIITGEERS